MKNKKSNSNSINNNNVLIELKKNITTWSNNKQNNKDSDIYCDNCILLCNQLLKYNKCKIFQPEDMKIIIYCLSNTKYMTDKIEIISEFINEIYLLLQNIRENQLSSRFICEDINKCYIQYIQQSLYLLGYQNYLINNVVICINQIEEILNCYYSNVLILNNDTNINLFYYMIEQMLSNVMMTTSISTDNYIIIFEKLFIRLNNEIPVVSFVKVISMISRLLYSKASRYEITNAIIQSIHNSIDLLITNKSISYIDLQSLVILFHDCIDLSNKSSNTLIGDLCTKLSNHIKSLNQSSILIDFLIILSNKSTKSINKSKLLDSSIDIEIVYRFLYAILTNNLTIDINDTLKQIYVNKYDNNTNNTNSYAISKYIIKINNSMISNLKNDSCKYNDYISSLLSNYLNGLLFIITNYLTIENTMIVISLVKSFYNVIICYKQIIVSNQIIKQLSILLTNISSKKSNIEIVECVNYICLFISNKLIKQIENQVVSLEDSYLDSLKFTSLYTQLSNTSDKSITSFVTILSSYLLDNQIVKQFDDPIINKTLGSVDIIDQLVNILIIKNNKSIDYSILSSKLINLFSQLSINDRQLLVIHIESLSRWNNSEDISIEISTNLIHILDKYMHSSTNCSINQLHSQVLSIQWQLYLNNHESVYNQLKSAQELLDRLPENLHTYQSDYHISNYLLPDLTNIFKFSSLYGLIDIQSYILIYLSKLYYQMNSYKHLILQSYEELLVNYLYILINNNIISYSKYINIESSIFPIRLLDITMKTKEYIKLFMYLHCQLIDESRYSVDDLINNNNEFSNYITNQLANLSSNDVTNCFFILTSKVYLIKYNNCKEAYKYIKLVKVSTNKSTSYVNSIQLVEYYIQFADILEHCGFIDSCLSSISQALVISNQSTYQLYYHIAILHYTRLLHRIHSKKLSTVLNDYLSLTIDSNNYLISSINQGINLIINYVMKSNHCDSKSLFFRYMYMYWRTSDIKLYFNMCLHDCFSNMIDSCLCVQHKNVDISCMKSLLEYYQKNMFNSAVKDLRRLICLSNHQIEPINRFILGASSMFLSLLNLLDKQSDNTPTTPFYLLSKYDSIVSSSCLGNQLDTKRVCNQLDILRQKSNICYIFFDHITNQLCIGKYYSKNPLTIRLNLNDTMKDILDEWKMIMIENEKQLDITNYTNNSADITDDIKRKWWLDRQENDSAMKEFIDRLENLLGPWKYLLLSKEMKTSRLNTIDSELDQLVNTLTNISIASDTTCNSLNQWMEYLVFVSTLDTSISRDEVIKHFEYIIDFNYSIDNKHKHQLITYFKSYLINYSTINTVSDSGNYSYESLDKLKVIELRNLCKQKQLVTNGKKSELILRLLDVLTHESKESVNGQITSGNHTVLLLDETLQALPWESMSFLCNQSCSRAPGLTMLLAMIESTNSSVDIDVNICKSWYLVDPDNNLQGSKDVIMKYLQPYIDKYDWSGITSTNPDKEITKNALTHSDLFIYCGHGSGDKYIDSHSLRKQKCPSALLWGCSSAKLIDRGYHNPTGAVINYLLGGSVFVCGNLWDVTDKDIDRYSTRFMDTVLPQISPINDSINDSNNINKEVGKASQISRDICKLKYIVGSSPVVYGLQCKLIDK